MSKEVIIKCENIRKQFKDNVVLDGVNLEVRKGEILGIIGMSGGGKTTLLNTMIGFYQPEEGDVLFKLDGIINKKDKTNFGSVFKHPMIVRSSFGFAPQDPSYYPKLSSEENLHHFGVLYSLPKKVRTNNIEQLLRLTRLYDSKKTLAGHISFGMQKRLGIACALVHKPKILILDEPTADLDPILREEVWDMIDKIRKQGTSVIISTHFLDEVEGICDRIAVLHNGKMRAVGTLDELRKDIGIGDEIVLKTQQKRYSKISAKLKRMKKSIGLAKVVKKGERLKVYVNDANKALYPLSKMLKDMKERIIDIKVNESSLKEVFEVFSKR